jgi:uncharacterized membrane protein
MGTKMSVTTDNVIVVGFDDESKAYQAFSELKSLGASGAIKLHGAAVVKRDDYGTLSIKEVVTENTGRGTAVGGLVGAFVGILGGPIGVLLGWGAGSMIGASRDVSELAEDQALLTTSASVITNGSTGLVAEVGESSPQAVNNEMGKLGGRVARMTTDEVLEEIKEAEEAQEAAQKEARRVLSEKKSDERKTRIQGFVDDIRDLFKRDDDAK